AQESVERLTAQARKTWRPEVLSGIGGFAGIVRMNPKWQNPCLVAGSDGVGTKLKVAMELGKHHTVGIDLVAMCVNDVLCSGAEPLFFLDYFACGKFEEEVFASVLSGVIEGCREAQCTLLGGETAEMPDMYPEGEYDLAGFAVGVVEEGKIVDGRGIREGDVIVGLPSSGLHSNGFSLVRKVLKENGIPFDAEIEGRSLAEELLRPTRIYVPIILALLPEIRIKGMAHITGGGIVENLPRVFPEGVGAQLRKGNIEVPWIFTFLQRVGEIPEQEMWRVFNMGIGFVVIVAGEEASRFIELCHYRGEKPVLLGEIVRGKRKVEFLG
ncbi:MAG: phosphoribosylformylglycinamidine cyclo-ligase, partial [Candidatus Caldatribacteriaceae bacterium]